MKKNPSKKQSRLARRLGFLLLSALFFISKSAAQPKQKFYKYMVELTDKNGTPHCSCRPADFLSAAALERRAQAGIAVTDEDLPVVPAYLSEIKKTGAELHAASRWLNAVAVKVAGRDTIEKIAALPFVKKVSYLGPHLSPRHSPRPPAKPRPSLPDGIPVPKNFDTFWGFATHQNSMLGVLPLHEMQFLGQGIRVAVMDGGFTNTDISPFFDTAWAAGRIQSAWDVVERDGYVFEAAAHGHSVLSVMASYLPGYFVGTAPAATYFCIKTEDTGGEFPIEEFNWVVGAELADSLGAHLINASLGYTHFNDTSLNHHFRHLDGRTAIASRGARIAATKGMIVCNSAGNSGDEPWRHVGVPADAEGIVSVGAVNRTGRRASFSSVGPTADGRIKPDLVAPGEMVVVGSTKSVDLEFSNGTSLASPMLTGALASLWSAFPEKTAAEILDAVYKTTSQSLAPDNQLGWGLPNLAEAWLELAAFSAGKRRQTVRVLPFSFSKNKNNEVKKGSLMAWSAASGELSVLLPTLFFEKKPTVAVLKNWAGQSFHAPKIEMVGKNWQKIVLSGWQGVPRGNYQLLIFGEKEMLRLVLNL